MGPRELTDLMADYVQDEAKVSQLETRNLKSETRNPESEIQNPKPEPRPQRVSG